MPRMRTLLCSIHFFFNDTATTEIYTLSLHDALPISLYRFDGRLKELPGAVFSSVMTPIEEEAIPIAGGDRYRLFLDRRHRSEEHTSELQSHLNIVCRLLLEKKNMISS